MAKKHPYARYPQTAQDFHLNHLYVEQLSVPIKSLYRYLRLPCFYLKYPSEFDASWPCLVVSMDRKGGSYGYFAPEIKPDSINDGWANYKFEYLTPEIRNRNDILKIYIWKRSKKSFDVDNFMVKIFEKN